MGLKTSRRMRQAKHVARIKEMKSFGAQARRVQTARKIYRCRWEDNIRMDIRQIRWGCVD